MAELIAIYGLYDPESGALRYIGKTISPKKRLAQHCRGNANQMHMPVVRWCRDLRLRSLSPRMEVLTWCRDWETAERKLIAAHRKAGVDLLNVASGGTAMPETKRTSLKGLCPTSVLYRAVIMEFVAALQAMEELNPLVRRCFDDMMRDYRAIRSALLRKGEIWAVTRFDINLWAFYVNKTPLEWHMDTMQPVRDDSSAYRRPIVDAARDALVQYDVIPA